VIKSIEKLRAVTGAGVMECKMALEETQGDFDKALEIIQEKGYIKAEKKATRATGAGFLETYIHNNRVGVLLEIRCETDFAAHSDPFKNLAHELAMQIAAMNPGNVEDLLKQPYIKDENSKIEDVIKTTIAKIGENIRVERFCRYEL